MTYTTAKKALGVLLGSTGLAAAALFAVPATASAAVPAESTLTTLTQLTGLIEQPSPAAVDAEVARLTKEVSATVLSTTVLSTYGPAQTREQRSAMAQRRLAAASSGNAAAVCGTPKIVSAAYLRRFGGSPVVGAVQLRRDDCSRYWGDLTMYEKMPKNAFATAFITKLKDGSSVTWSCDSAGGNGRVTENQTTCHTPKIAASDTEIRLIASAHEYHGGNGGWARVSWGQTPATR